MRPIVLLGLMGTGKTSVGVLLAERLGRPLRDSDADLLAAHGHTAAELNVLHGADYLHELEARHLFDALAEPSVICAAASVVERADCREALAGAFVVWLDAPVEVLVARFHSAPHRPRFRSDIAAMLTEQAARRRPLFAAVADLVIDVTQNTPATAASLVLASAG
jgi:shikimate kinase